MRQASERSTNITTINLPPALTKVETIIERCCAAEGLHITLKGTLAGYPGCIHWHLKKGNQPGTLEITFWPKAYQCWFKVSAGRTGDWIAESAARLAACLSTE